MSADRHDPAPPFWLVWNRYGRRPVYEHASYESARAEAERLARTNPGSAFYVLAPAARGGYDRTHICWSHYVSQGNDTEDDFNGAHAPNQGRVE